VSSILQANKNDQETFFEETLCCDACAALGADNPAEFSLSWESEMCQKDFHAESPVWPTSTPAWRNLCATHYGQLSVEQKQAYARLDTDEEFLG